MYTLIVKNKYSVFLQCIALYPSALCLSLLEVLFTCCYIVYRAVVIVVVVVYFVRGEE